MELVLTPNMIQVQPAVVVLLIAFRKMAIIIFWHTEQIPLEVVPQMELHQIIQIETGFMEFPHPPLQGEAYPLAVQEQQGQILPPQHQVGLVHLLDIQYQFMQQLAGPQVQAMEY